MDENQDEGGAEANASSNVNATAGGAADNQQMENRDQSNR